MKQILFLMISIGLSSAQAFVENVSHGYPACIACHISPSGGGVTTDYGRSLSKELMSTWGGPWSGFENPGFGAFKNTKHVKFGGDFRAIDTTVRPENGPGFGSQFTMQSNFEIALKFGKFTFVKTSGTRQGPASGFSDADRLNNEGKGDYISERYYGMYNITPTDFVRVGKFRRSFGIYEPNHRRYVKNSFGFGSNSETHNIEYTKIYEDMEYAVGLSLGNLEDGSDERVGQSIWGTFSHYLEGKSRVGGSLLVEDNDILSRQMLSVHAVHPLVEHTQIVSEIVYGVDENKGSNLTSNRFASNIRLIAESKGIKPYVFFEHLTTDSEGAPTSTQTAPGVGLQWLPIPHVNLQFEYSKIKTKGAPGSTEAYWALIHLYN